MIVAADNSKRADSFAGLVRFSSGKFKVKRDTKIFADTLPDYSRRAYADWRFEEMIPVASCRIDDTNLGLFRG